MPEARIYSVALCKTSPSSLAALPTQTGSLMEFFSVPGHPPVRPLPTPAVVCLNSASLRRLSGGGFGISSFEVSVEYVGFVSAMLYQGVNVVTEW